MAPDPTQIALKAEVPREEEALECDIQVILMEDVNFVIPMPPNCSFCFTMAPADFILLEKISNLGIVLLSLSCLDSITLRDFYKEKNYPSKMSEKQNPELAL